MKKYFDSLISSSGRPISGASITVYTSGTSTLASLFSTSSGTALTNPVTSNSSGYFEFYAADGRYDLSISSTGYGSQSVTDILLEDPADANSAVINGGTINGTSIGATIPSTGAFTTLSATGNTTLGNASTDTVTVSGNVGVGVTPSAWSIKALQIGSATGGFVSGQANQALLGSNAYFNGTWNYGGSFGASYYEQASGKHTWYTAPSGTAGNPITFTQALAINASGSLQLFSAPTVSAPAYVKGAMYFDTTLNKLRIGGATAWETVTSV